jgi:MFS transporter, DHA1 family, inner membrane transport protein
MATATQPNAAFIPSGMLLPGLVVALAQLGDSLIYAVLPLYADEFGVSLFVVGVLLSLNRWTRLVAYTVVAAIAERVGPRRLMIGAASTATLATLGYWYPAGEAMLMASRVLWGLSFAALNLSMLAYATSDKPNAGKRIATGRTAIGLFQTLSLIVGTAMVASLGARGVFLAVAAVSAIAIVLAWRLVPLPPSTEANQGFRLPLPGRLELWGLALGLIIDGIFIITLSLLLKDNELPFAPVVATGCLLAIRWGMEVITAPIGGVMADRFGATRLALVTGGLLVIGLALIAAGWDLAGAALVVTMRGMFNTLMPVMVAQRARSGALASQATYSTWRDLGAAVGPVVGGLAFGAVAPGLLYGVSAAILAVGLWWCIARSSQLGRFAQ